MRIKTISILALLLTAVSGAWATKKELNKFWPWDVNNQQVTQSGVIYTSNIRAVACYSHDISYLCADFMNNVDDMTAIIS